MGGKDDFVPWDEGGGGCRFGPISRYAKSDKLISSPIMVSSCAIYCAQLSLVGCLTVPNNEK